MFEIPARSNEFEQLCECLRRCASAELAGPELLLVFLNAEKSFCHLDIEDAAVVVVEAEAADVVAAAVVVDEDGDDGGGGDGVCDAVKVSTGLVLFVL